MLFLRGVYVNEGASAPVFRPVAGPSAKDLQRLVEQIAACIACVLERRGLSERLPLTASGHVRYALETPYRDGTTHIVLEPLDLMARLAALVPPPRMHLTRFHGVFAPHSKLRAALSLRSGAWAPRASRQRTWPRRRHRGMWPGHFLESCRGA